MLTRTNFVTLKYVTDNWGTDANGFKLVITSVKDPSKYNKYIYMLYKSMCVVVIIIIKKKKKNVHLQLPVIMHLKYS